MPAVIEKEPQLPAAISTKIAEAGLNAAPLAPIMTLEEAGATFERTKAFIACNLSLKSGDIYVLPGSQKPVLAKSGAEKLAAFFSCVPEYDEIQVTEDWNRQHPSGVNAPYFYYRIRCRLVWRANSKQVGEGMGLCHSWESKYLWREGKRLCPKCGASTIYESKPEWGGGYYCNKTRGGCGAGWKAKPWQTQRGNWNQPSEEDLQIVAELEAQATGRVINPDMGDVANTAYKIAQKRSLAPAVITALGIGGLFTQDIEDWAQYDQAAANSAGTVTKDMIKTMRDLGILNEQDAIDVEATEVTEEQAQAEAKEDEAKKQQSSSRSPRSRTTKPKDAPSTANGGTQATPTTTATAPPPAAAAVVEPSVAEVATNGAAASPGDNFDGATNDEVAAAMLAQMKASNYTGDQLKTALRAQFKDFDPAHITRDQMIWVVGYMKANPLKVKAAAGAK